jgi:hypothetical protein
MPNHKARHHDNAKGHTEEQRQEQSEHRWQDFLNGNWGVFGFPLGLACLTTKTPSFNALLCILFVTALWARGRHLVPKHFLSKGHGEIPDHRPWSRRQKFWMGTGPALLGYLYLCFILVSQPIEDYCTQSRYLGGLAWAAHHYVGAPS